MKVSGEYTVIPPIIADLDGNGVNEVVLITKDLELKVHYGRCEYRRSHHELNGDIYTLDFVRLFRKE